MNEASRPLRAMPPVERITEGLWSVPVPLPIESLRYVFVYVLETPEGPYLVDTGWGTAEAWIALREGITRVGYRVEDVQGVMVTHAHPDHYGLAGRIREESGCWVGMHQREAEAVRRQAEQADAIRDFDPEDLMRQAGAPEEALRRLSQSRMPRYPVLDLVEPDRLIEDGEELNIAGWDIRAIWTPGHTPGHLCFHLPELDALISGDHLLPRITPNISYHAEGATNPLGDFLSSLSTVAALAPAFVYPAHEYRFVGIEDRVATIVQHHEDHLDEILNAFGSGAVTTWEVASKMSWSGRWDSFDTFKAFSALSEATAHIRALEARAQVYEVAPHRWELAPIS